MYPNKPKEIPFDNSDLIQKQLNQFKRNNSSITKNGFNRLILLHPDLINKVNEILYIFCHKNRIILMVNYYVLY